jgi:hypothetical protein
MRDRRRGQALVEFVLVLPFLLLILIGLVELGYGFYDYMVMANANREGVRLGARGRFEDETVIERILIAGGWRQSGTERILQTAGPNRNTGLILTHIPIDPAGNLVTSEIVRYITGTIAADGGVLRPIQVDDSRVTDIESQYATTADLTGEINDYRETHGYESQRNEIVIVETFVAHSLLFDFDFILPLSNPISLYFRSAMRVSRDASVD